MLWLIFILLILFALIAAPVTGIHQRRRALAEALGALEGFTPDRSYSDDYGQTAIALDQVNKRIALLKHYEGRISSRVVSRQRLLAVKLLTDCKLQVSRVDQWGLVILGGLVAGGIGAVIGGLLGSKSRVRKVKGVRLQLVIDDNSDPVHRVTFLEGEHRADSPLCRRALKQARHWQALLEAL